MREYIHSGAEKKLSKSVYDNIPALNFYKFKALIRKGDVKVNGKKTYDDVTVFDGDNIKVYFKEEAFSPKTVFEDKHIVVYYKPEKIASEGPNSFAEKINEIYPDYILAHRLDTNTSGLIIFAKSKEAFDALVAAFKEHSVKKYYLTCVAGTVKSAATYTDYLVKDGEKARVKIFSTKVPNSEQIITKIKPVKYTKGVTYAEVELVTGRTHQIRAHLAYRGFPIVGDGKYGDYGTNKKYGAALQMLICYKLIFEIKSGMLSYLDGKEIKYDTTEFFKI